MSADCIEPTPIPDIYADDIASVELLGPNVRMTYFTWQDGQKIAVCKLVRPRDSVKGTVRFLVDKAIKAMIGNQLRLN